MNDSYAQARPRDRVAKAKLSQSRAESAHAAKRNIKERQDSPCRPLPPTPSHPVSSTSPLSPTLDPPVPLAMMLSIVYGTLDRPDRSRLPPQEA